MSKAKKVLKIALPAVGEMLLYMLVWVVDTAFVGNYGGNNAVSAVGFSSEIVYTIANIFIAMGIGIGITTLVAQSIGAKEKESAEEYLGQGFFLGAVIALIIALTLGIFAHKILVLTGVKGEVLRLATQFMRLVSIGAFFSMINSLLNAGLRGSGNTMIPLLISIIVNIVTIFLDWVLIFGRFGIRPLGVVGSGIATSVAYFTGFIVLIFYYRLHSVFKLHMKNIININKVKMKALIKLSVPSGLQETAFSASRLLTVVFVMHLGVAAFAANQITTTIESISFMPGWGFAVAATALVGQSIGAKDLKNAKQYALYSAGFGLMLMLICSVLFLVIPEALFGIFIKEEATIQMGKMCLMIAAIEQPFMALGMVMGGALKGSGNTKTPFLVSLVTNWCIRVPLTYYVVFIANVPVYYVWLVMVVQWIFEGSLVLYFFMKQSRDWKTC